MDQISNLKIKLTAETAKFTEEVNRAKSSLSGLGGSVKNLNLTKIALGGVAVAATAAATAFLAVASAAMQGLSIYAQTEQYLARTEAQLKATGAAVGFTAQELDKFAREVAMNTLASTDGVRSAISVMMTFKSVTGNTFKESIKLAQDLAETFGTDVSSEARNLGRALQEPTKAAEMLKRKGVELSEAQQDLIEKFTEAGEKGKAQDIILQALRDTVGGAGEAAAKDTLNGALDTLGQAYDELKEDLAQATGLTTAYTAVVNTLAKAFIWLKKQISGSVDLKEISQDLESAIAKNEQILANKLKYAKENQFAGGLDPSEDIKYYQDLIEKDKKKLSKINYELVQKEAEEIARLEEAETQKQKAELNERQKAGAASLKALNDRMLTRRQKLDAQYNKDVEMVKKLELSKEDIAKQGFKNIEELRAAHLSKLQNQYDKDSAALLASETRKTKGTSGGGKKEKTERDNVSSLDLRYATEAHKLDLNHKIQLRKIQQMTFSESEIREKGFKTTAELRGYYLNLESQAYEKQIEDLKNKEIKEQKDKENRVRDFFNDIRGSSNDPYLQNDLQRDDQLAKAQELHDQLLLSTEQFEQAKAEIEEAYRRRKEDLDRQAVASQLSAAASLFDGLAGLVEMSAGKNSAAYRAMFAISKSFQIAESMLHLQAAVMKAMNDPTAVTPAQKFANMAAVASAGASVLNQLSSITLSGARANGGPVGGGRAYLVGERGPEIFVPNASGQITSNENLNKALGGSPGGNVVIYQTNNFDGENKDNIQLAKMVAEATKTQVYSILRKESRNGGMLRG